MGLNIAATTPPALHLINSSSGVGIGGTSDYQFTFSVNTTTSGANGTSGWEWQPAFALAVDSAFGVAVDTTKHSLEIDECEGKFANENVGYGNISIKKNSLLPPNLLSNATCYILRVAVHAISDIWKASVKNT